MAYQLAAWIQCNDQQQAELIKQLLERDTRPCFVEDVPAHHQALFELLDQIEYPAETTLDQDRLWLFWYMADYFGFDELTTLLDRLELTALFIFEVPDDPLVGDSYEDEDEDEASGRFWMLDKGVYVRVNRTTVTDKFPDSIVERLPE